MDNTDFDAALAQATSCREFVGYALRELRGDDMDAVRFRIARQSLRN